MTVNGRMGGTTPAPLSFAWNHCRLTDTTRCSLPSEQTSQGLASTPLTTCVRTSSTGSSGCSMSPKSDSVQRSSTRSFSTPFERRRRAGRSKHCTIHRNVSTTAKGWRVEAPDAHVYLLLHVCMSVGFEKRFNSYVYVCFRNDLVFVLTIIFFIKNYKGSLSLFICTNT